MVGLANQTLSLPWRRHTVLMLLILLALFAVSLGGRKSQKGRKSHAQRCEASAHACHAAAECVATRRSYRCICKTGFLGDGKVCKDEDECAHNNGGCAQMCINAPGNYTCACQDGFNLASDGKDCIDKNECLDHKRGGCSDHCRNTMGSFECGCSRGYSLDDEGKTCKFGEWCKKTHGCDHGCKSSASGNLVHCFCRKGYLLHADGKRCFRSCKHGNGGCQHKCTDTDKGPLCSCAGGYFLNADNRSCTATCQVNNGGCEKRCIDSEEGPICSCPNGLRLHQDGTSCIDIDECERKAHGCSHECVNIRGSFECVCPTGFKVHTDMRTCVDINECLVNSTCDHICENMPGSYRCSCREGYQLYGMTHCADVNECLIRNGGCAHDCNNSDGGYSCKCREGYKLHTNNHDCIDARQCTPLTQRPNSRLTCAHSGPHSQKCVMTCSSRAFLTFLPRHDQRNLGIYNANNTQQGVSGVIGPAPGLATFSCGPDTGFNWAGLGSWGELPYCSDLVSAPSVSRRATFVFSRRNCKVSRNDVRDMRGNLTLTFNSEKKYKCDGQCRVRELGVICGARKKFRKYVRRKRHALLTAKFEVQMDPKKINKKCGPACMTRRTYKKFGKAFKKIRRVIKRRKFLVRFGGETHKAVKKSFRSEKRVDKFCYEGLELLNKTCIGCSHGFFYNRKQSRCEPCRKGTYQDREGQLECIACPKGRPGSGIVAATSLDECDSLCEPGMYSQSGQKPCQPCGPGTFQPNFGRQSCLPCGQGLHHDTTGSSTFALCGAKEICQPGQFYNKSTHECSPCKLGWYQPEKGQDICLPCPANTTTDFPGSISPNDCKDRRCREMVSEHYGVLESPNYPGDYPINVTCAWKIRPQRRRRILIIIPRIELADEKTCGDYLVMRKSKSESSQSTFETCASRDRPIAFTARSKKLWVEFKSNENNTAAGFSIPFVMYNEEYESLIEDIVRDSRLYSSRQHQQIFQDRKLLTALLEVIATPYNYLKYANVSHTMFPPSFIKLLTPKVRRFFQT